VLIVSLCWLASGVNIYRCPPSIQPDGDWSRVQYFSDFKLAQHPSESASQRTVVHLCYTESALLLRYDCEDDYIRSPYTTCNQALYNTDVVEVFLTKVYSGTSVDLHHYVELEVSPNSVLFVAHIANQNLVCDGIQDQLVNCNQSGVVWLARRSDSTNSWWAYLSIPWQIIGGTPVAGYSFSGNFFRINLFRNSTIEYSCWQSTDSDPACFHKPNYFGNFYFT